MNVVMYIFKLPFPSLVWNVFMGTASPQFSHDIGGDTCITTNMLGGWVNDPSVIIHIYYVLNILMQRIFEFPRGYGDGFEQPMA